MKSSVFDYDLEQLRYWRDIALAELSFYEFFKQSWPIIEGKVPYKDGWHIQAVCEHLEAVARRQIKKLLINMPPRLAKSNMTSVAFPAWIWARLDAGERFMYASYARSLSIKHSMDCRRLIMSPWYQQRWGHQFQLMPDQNAKTRFDNDKKGYRIATAVGATTTGEGANFLIIDDGNNAKDALSPAKRESTIQWLTQAWSTRLNDKKNDCEIMVNQRLHVRDVSGFILDSDDSKEWVTLILPMEYEESRKCRTMINGITWEDPRTKEGELLWPAGIDEKALVSLKQKLGSEYAISGQMQQRPSPEGGGCLKKAWFRHWKDETPPKIEFLLQSWDTALTNKDTSSYYACTTWGVFLDENKMENVILLSMWRGRVGYPEAREMAKRLYFDYRDTGEEHNPKLTGRTIDMCLIEAKAAGDPLIQDLARAGIRAFPFDPTPYGNKRKRVHLVSHLIESGMVWVRAKPPKFERLMPDAEIFVEACGAFPMEGTEDLVDTMSQALSKLKQQRLILNRQDERYSPYYEERNIEY